MKDFKIGVIGLGYVGLPIFLSLSKHFDTVGFDINEKRVFNIKNNIDTNEDIEVDNKNLVVGFSESILNDCNFYIITVPTPVDKNKEPDLSYVKYATELVAKNMTRDAIIVYESTVYPGVTEEICGSILKQYSNFNYKLGYSPERINPGDKEHTLENIVKIISAEDKSTLDDLEYVYSKIIKAGVYKAPSIKVAEAAKVIENIQRDLNISLVNELSIIFDKMNIDTIDVLLAAETKWNFVKFRPGLVGGHCIGVDPYYLTYKAKQIGYDSKVILAGRDVNDNMADFIVSKVIKESLKIDKIPKNLKISIFGITFKENVKDIRNSKIPDIVFKLREYGINPLVYDCLSDPDEVMDEYGICLSSEEDVRNSDIAILAVSHDKMKSFIKENLTNFRSIIDVKSILQKEEIPKNVSYWRL